MKGENLAVKKIIVALSFLVIITVGAIYSTNFAKCSNVLWEDDFENGLFMFNSSIHAVYSPQWTGSAIVRGTFEDYDNERHPGRAMIIGEVAGPSVNRIINPRWELRDHHRDFYYGSGDNHVITPILVHEIIFLGTEVDELIHVKVGEVIDVIEGYYFVTPETQAYAHGARVGQVRTVRGARPMESGNRYLLYIHHGGNRASSIYHYNYELILSAMGRSQVYHLGSLLPRARMDSQPNPLNIPGWHEAALSRHDHLHQSLPLAHPAPIITPRTSNELTIIIQGTPIATAIYDGDGNRLIQQGLDLYRETNARTLERVGERVSLSHALRRYRYILEPGEWVFKNLDFSTTALPASFQIMAFDNYEQVAMSYYANTPSSSNMELHVMPNGRATLIDRAADVVISPTKIFP